LKLFFGMF